MCRCNGKGREVKMFGGGFFNENLRVVARTEIRIFLHGDSRISVCICCCRAQVFVIN